MKNKNGFTLVELLAVIVLLGLIMTIAIPNALKLGSNVKEKTYGTKIELIEKSAATYGQSNISIFKNVNDSCVAPNGQRIVVCHFMFDGDGNVSNVEIDTTHGYNCKSTNLPDDYHLCYTMSVEDLVKNNSLDYDEKNTCGGGCSNEEKLHYDNVVVNPKDNSVINLCQVYIYFKYKRIYTFFDRDECDKTTAAGVYSAGKSYQQINRG